MLMKSIGIVGSRRRRDYWNIWELVETFSENTVVISGGCKGPDKWATEHAKLKGLKIVEYLPELPPSGSPRYEFTKAYYARNKKIAENVDVLYAFVAPDRKGGTENTIGYAEKLGKEIHIV
jgi:predicted Rossmann fold nucleotide-binding protein DprA/Smf involved in DNA uptake